MQFATWAQAVRRSVARWDVRSSLRRFGNADELLADLPQPLRDAVVLASRQIDERWRTRARPLARADELFGALLKDARLAPKHFRRAEREWIELAERESRAGSAEI